jgi:hypothetical protein
MAASRSSLMAWFDEGVAQRKSHMIISCDLFDAPDCCYPVYVDAGQDPREVVKDRDKPGGDPTREVYVLDPARRAEQFAPGTTVFCYDPYVPA